VLAWAAWIAASRLYLGLHTPIDILAGAVAGLTVVTCFIGLEGGGRGKLRLSRSSCAQRLTSRGVTRECTLLLCDRHLWLASPQLNNSSCPRFAAYIDAWVRSPRLALPLAAAVSAVLLRLHPRPLNPTPTFAFTTSFMGVMFGVCGSIAGNSAFYDPPVQLAAVWAHSPLWCLRRLAAGFALVLASKEVSRAAAAAARPPLYGWFPVRLRRMWQPPVHNACAEPLMRDPALRDLPHGASGRPADVEATSRFFAYAGIGVAACGLAPRMFAALGW
jgi:hypothetical protein